MLFQSFLKVKKNKDFILTIDKVFANLLTTPQYCLRPLHFGLHIAQKCKKSVAYIYQHIIHVQKPSKDQNTTFVQRGFFQKGYRKNIFAKNMKKIMIFWLIFNFCFMVLKMHAAIMELLNKIFTKRKKLKAQIQKSSLAKMFLWSKTT